MSRYPYGPPRKPWEVWHAGCLMVCFLLFGVVGLAFAALMLVKREWGHAFRILLGACYMLFMGGAHILIGDAIEWNRKRRANRKPLP